MNSSAQDPPAMHDARSLGNFADLFRGRRIARSERERFDALLDEIEVWISDEESRCYHVAVLTGRVSAPIAIEAVKETLGGEHKVTCLFPVEEVYTRRLGVGTPVLGVVATGRDEAGYLQKRYALFRRPK